MARAWLYVIELEPEKDPLAKWYVGITDNPRQRYRKHANDYGAYWTHRNECVDLHILGSLKSKRHARRSENQLTLALWDEFGAGTTQGGKYVGEGVTSEPVPLEVDTQLDPTVANWLGESDSDELASLSDRGQMYIEVFGKVPFEDKAAAEEWVDKELPEGTGIRLSSPEHDYGTFTAEDAMEKRRRERHRELRGDTY